MKNRFSLTTAQPNNTKALPKRWSERHVKNITSLEKYIFNLPHCCNYTLEKSLIFSDHLTTQSHWVNVVHHLCKRNQSNSITRSAQRRAL